MDENVDERELVLVLAKKDSLGEKRRLVARCGEAMAHPETQNDNSLPDASQAAAVPYEVQGFASRQHLYVAVLLLEHCSSPGRRHKVSK